MISIVTDGLSVRFGATDVLSDINLKIERGIYQIVGANGSGKSTFLKTLLGLVKPTGGQLCAYEGDSLIGRYHRFVRYNFSPCPDPEQLPGILSASDYALFVSKLRKVESGNLDQFFKLGELLQIDFSNNQSIGTFSQGMKQKLCIAATFIGDRPFLVFDESFSNLDQSVTTALLEGLPDLMKAHKTQTVLFVAHGISTVPFANHVLHFETGKLRT